jgi:adenylylsulfate kinase
VPAIVEHVVALARSARVFIKETSDNRLADLVKTALFKQATNIAFLIREPAAVIASHLKLRPEAGVNDFGFAHLRELMSAADQAGYAFQSLSAEELVADPRASLGRYCQAAGLPWRDAMLSWEPEDREEWQRTRRWHGAASESTGFLPPSPERAEPVPAELLAAVQDDYSAILRWHDRYANRNPAGLTDSGQPVIWMTGLPGAGKSTIAKTLHHSLKTRGFNAIVLDGDTLRGGLCSDLGFSNADRNENIRRFAHVAKLFQQEGYVVIVATISPMQSHRDLARTIVGDSFVETFIATPFDICRERDPKGMYAKALQGQLTQFTGVSDTYEQPAAAEIVVDTSDQDVAESVERIVTHLGQRLRAHR